MMSDWHMPEICWFQQICLFWKSHRNPVLKMLLISIGSSKTNMALLHARQDNKADKSASNSLNPSIFEGLVTLCAPDAVCFSRHIPHASGRILAERFLFDRKFIVISYQTKKLSPEYHKHHCHIAYDSSRTALYLQLSVQKRPHHYCCT